jgi:hypothetical protein
MNAFEFKTMPLVTYDQMKPLGYLEPWEKLARKQESALDDLTGFFSATYRNKRPVVAETDNGPIIVTDCDLTSVDFIMHGPK